MNYYIKENEIKRENMLYDYKIYEESLTNRLKEFENWTIKLKENPIDYINFEFKESKK